MPRRPNLLLCFDAFGTLFRPRRHVALQYADVARQCGLTTFSDEDLKSSFSNAFKQEAARNPNYGKKTGLGAEQWWANVIHSTFDRFLTSGQEMPTDLAPRLLHRFSSDEAYTIEPTLLSSFRTLREMRTSEHFSTIVTGVITNSDDRVPDILSSFGLRVSPLRYGMLDTAAAGEMGHDIDFHCMSYDVGYEKPDKRVFTAAEEMLNIILDSRESQRGPDGCWLKIYVGDEYGKDVEGSTNAGWKAIFLDPTGSSPQIPRVEDHYDVLLSDAFQQQPVMRVQSIQNMIHWLVTPK